ncbi:hypothetical protein ACFL0M_11765, partial [Thermodesulfobacteriota bacterium]
MFGDAGVVDIFILPCQFFYIYCMCCKNEQASTISESPQNINGGISPKSTVYNLTYAILGTAGT